MNVPFVFGELWLAVPLGEMILHLARRTGMAAEAIMATKTAIPTWPDNLDLESRCRAFGLVFGAGGDLDARKVIEEFRASAGIPTGAPAARFGPVLFSSLVPT